MDSSNDFDSNDDQYVNMYEEEEDQEDQEFVYDSDDDIQTEDDRVWDGKTNQFKSRVDMWCSFEDEYEQT